MSKEKRAGRTSGLATLELMEGLRQLKLNPKVYRSDKQVHDPEQVNDDPTASYVSEYEYTALPHQSSSLSPEYSWIGKTYWHADIQILKDIQKDLKIRYPKSHPDKALQVIPENEIYPTDYSDFFFSEFKLTKLDGDRRMKAGIYTFNCEDPVDRLLFYSYKYHPDCEVFGEELDVYKSGKKRWRLMMPEIEQKEKLVAADSQIQAIALLDSKRGIEKEKMRIIAEIMNIRDISYKDSSDDDIRLALLSQAANSDRLLTRWDMTANEVLIYLGDKINNTQLQRMLTLVRAMEYNVITRTGNTYRFNEE